MTVLRSREIVPNKAAPKTKLKIEPSTPTQTHELSTFQSPTPPMSKSSSLSPNPSPSPNPNPGSTGLGSDSVSVSGVIRRRSLRLALKPDSGLNSVSDGPRRRKRNTSASSRAEEADGGVLGLGLVGNGEMGFGLIGERVRVLEEKEGVVELGMVSAVDPVSGNGLGLGEVEKVEDEGKSARSLGEFGLGSDMESIGRKSDVAKGKRKLSVGVNLFGEYGGKNEESNGVLNLRSGKRVPKRQMDGVGSGGDKLVDEREGKEEEQEDNGELVKEISDVENGSTSVNRERRFKREEKGKAKLLNDVLVSKGVEVVEMGLEQDAGNLSDNVIENDGSKLVNERQGREGNRKGKRKLGGASDGGVVIENVEKVATGDENGGVKGRRRFSRQEKGKGKLINDSLLSNSDGELKLGIGMESKVNNSVDDVVSSTVDAVDNVVLQDEMKVRTANTRDKESNRRDYMERFRDIARENASRFALFVPQEEEENHAPPQAEVEREIEDWPGPFSTAMKIIKDRETKNHRVENSSPGKPALVKWVPRYSPNRSKRLVPSLKELCLTVLAKNADSIVSLENVPDALRHKLSQLLCDSRRMNCHFFELLVHGSPTEVRLRDCSWLTEEQFTKSFQECDTSNLTVLQLDQCGRCMPDYIILSTLARSSNSLPALTSLSLAGACRLSDVGLGKLVCAIPAVRSLNLSQCSLLTSSGIDTLADSLGSVLRELYLTDCQGIDPMLILPALKKLGQLQVLSIAGIQNVCDDFVGEFVTARGHNLKELVLTDCVKLTDSSLKVIAETCPGLCALDLMNLCKLTDSAIGYLANGCRAIQTLKLCRNAFSDEAFAAFLETSGESLQELSLNNVRKVGNNTAISLAKRSRKLHILDLSWCRNLSDEAMGLIVDNCLSLRVLKLFGCTQITNVFLDGHSNPEVQIIGLKMSPVLEHVKLPDPQEGPLHYSSI